MGDPFLLVIFLRGGCDGLSLVAPAGDADYVAARPGALRVAREGDDAGLWIDGANADADFRFHPRAGGLHELYAAGELAVIHAAGLTDGTRSHFDAEDRMERAAPGGSSFGGWLGRWLEDVRPEGLMPALAAASRAPDAFLGGAGVAVAEDLRGLITAEGNWLAAHLREHMARAFANDPLLGGPVQRLMTLSDIIEGRLLSPETGAVADYRPDVPYPDDSPFCRSLMTVARAIKLDLGLRVASIDYGDWDTHIAQAGPFAEQTKRLSDGMLAFWRDLGPFRDRAQVVVMSEFGRRLKANDSGGTDHGFGNVMLTLGPNVRGGRMYGTWPGLKNEALDAGADLDITTDYRHVLAEIMARHMGHGALERLFPGFVPEFRGFLG
jgi:uncharacterized protein (DUF1501 family)